jgi:hypothetical protein
MTRIILAGIGLFHLSNGLFMVADPGGWYFGTPGVSRTGPMNHHFIVDVGLAFSASGAGLLFVFRGGRAAAAFVSAGATWPALHALFHIVEWPSQGVPPHPGGAAIKNITRGR